MPTHWGDGKGRVDPEVPRTKDRSLWQGRPLVVDTRNLIAPLFQDAPTEGPKRLVKA